VSTEGSNVAERHFGGSYLRALIDFVQDAVGREGLAEVLERAGETRAEESLTDEGSWSSYEQFRRLLEAAGEVLGGPQKIVEVGIRLQEVSDASLTYALQALGSPEALFAVAASAGAAVCSIVDFRAEEIGEREWLLSQNFHDGFEPFEEFCALSTAMHQFGALVFGYPMPDVVEVECQRHGAPSCVFRIRWEETDEATRRANVLETKVRTLKGSLAEFEQTVADLISSEDLQTILSRTFTSASRAVRAPVFVLALREAPPSIRRVYSAGVQGSEAERIAADLLAGRHEEREGTLFVEVCSTRRAYGWLTATRPAGQFTAEEVPRLQAYAGFVAAALDSATALEEARRQSATAGALLELSTALAEIASVEEMAAKLVRAVPAVMNCDRAAILLPDPDGVHARVVVTYGCSTDIDRMLRAKVLPLPETNSSEPEFHQQQDERHSSLMSAARTEGSVVIPVIVDGSWAGSIVAGVTGDPYRLRDDPGTADRLRGLAAQASTAIRNARLLDQVRYQALHDPLTGLPNRMLILDRAEQMLSHARRDRRPAAAMFIDLDGFKEINDSFGHAVGDALLCSVTARLKATLRVSDTVGRLGGDEFVVLTDGAKLDVGPELVAERLLDVLRAPFLLSDHDVGLLSITASIGIATGDRDTAGELLRDADIALYQAKAAGKDQFRVFEPEMQTTLQHHLLLQMDLRSALDANEFFLVYQPICKLSSGQITGVEALLRWQHPTRGEIQPDQFIPALEQTGMIHDVGRWVLIEACRQGAEWRRRGLELDMAVNISARQLQTDQLLTDVDDALAFSDVAATSLILEITESTMMSDIQGTAERLSTLRALGVRIAIDDFGTGYSSLSVLRRFPVDTLKIDRAFVSALGDSTESTALIHTLVQLGKALGLETIAEGIEERTQYKQLEDEDCESGQGFLIARPSRAADLEAILEARDQLPRAPAASSWK
jgi:diguanylate cyclase (GGDEF)-like protein